MKKFCIVFLALAVLLGFLYFVSPQYVKMMVKHLYPNITDTYIFPGNSVEKADTVWEFAVAKDYNTYNFTQEEKDYLAKYETRSFLVVQNDSIVFEQYFDGTGPTDISNLFSSTKTITALLVGIAYDEGYIESLDDKISKYWPEYLLADKLTVRNLLTMSSGSDWNEAYTSPFAITSQQYYGDNLRELTKNIKIISQPGKKFYYSSGDTQMLAFVLEGALELGGAPQQTISDYLEAKLWQPMGIGNHGIWNLDREGGDEKGACCFNISIRDFAKFARLVLNRGEWNGKQLISRKYMDEMLTPASYIRNQFDDGELDYYGFQIWFQNYRGLRIPAFRGILSQYAFILEDQNALILRMGHARPKEKLRQDPVDVFEYIDMGLNVLEARR